ncbi:MAG: protein kinase, partial [Planctomycetes bacterium]|nr:protein kinase [Planctomycetota bacterium]
VKKFRREAEAGGRQKHPGIVAVHALGEEEGVHFIAHELVEECRTLGDFLEEARKRPDLPRGYFREVAGLLAEVAEALAHAHASGVIHRDVKPSNILLDSEGCAKVNDFGLARIEDALALSRSGDFAGTPYYMSPEQTSSRRQHIDHRTDIFSLGVTLYEMIALERPFDGETSHEVLKKILLLEPRDPCRVNPWVPRDLSVICLKAMEKKPEHRYGSMQDFYEDLQRFLAGEPISARPAGAVTKFYKRVRRSPVVSGALGIAALAVTALIAFFPFYIIKITNALSIAEGRRLIAESTAELDKNPGRALLLAMEGAKNSPGVLANNALLAALSVLNERKAVTHPHPVFSVAFSPDMSIMASGDSEGVLRIWDAATWVLKQTIEAHKSSINGLVFSPDSAYLATASEDATSCLWNPKTGEKIKEFFGHGGPVRSIDFSSDGRKVLTASADMTARIWETATGKELQTFKGHAWVVNSAVFDPQDKRIVTASEDSTVRLWDAETGETITILKSHTDVVHSAAFDASGTRILTASKDGTARVWNIGPDETISPSYSIFHNSSVRNAAFSPDNGQIVTACGDGIARVWNTGDFKALLPYQHTNRQDEEVEGFDDAFWRKVKIEPESSMQGHEATLTDLCFRSDGKQIVTASLDHTLRCWDMAGNLGVQSLSFHPQDNERWIAFSDDGVKIAWVDPNQKGFSVCNLQSGKTSSFRGDYKGWLDEVDFNTGGKKYNTVWKDGTLMRFDAITKEPHPAVRDETEYLIRSLRFTPKGRLMTSIEKNFLQIWNLETQKVEHAFEHRGDLRSFDFTRDESRILVAAGDCWVHDYDLKENREIGFIEKFDGNFLSLSLDHDSRRILTLSEFGKCELWSGDAFSPHKHIARLPVEVIQACFSPCDPVFLTLTYEGFLKLWNTESGTLIKTLKESMGEKSQACWCRDGKKIMAWDSSGLVRVWELENKEDPLNFSAQGRTMIVRAVLSGDGRWICLAMEDGNVDLFEADTGLLAASLSCTGSVLEIAFLGTERIAVATDDGLVRVWPLSPLKVLEKVKPRELTQLERSLFGMEGRETARDSAPSMPREKRKPEKKEPSKVSADSPDNETKPRLLLEEIMETLSKADLEPFCFVARRDQSYALMSFNPKEEEDRIKILHDFDPCFTGSYAVSAREAKVCFMQRNKEGHIDIMGLNIHKDAPSSAYLICHTDHSIAVYPAWHPDGTKIYLALAEDDMDCKGYHLCWVSTESPPDQKPTLLVGRPDQYFNIPSISPDGRRIGFIHYPGHSDNYSQEIWVADLSNSGTAVSLPKQLTSDRLANRRCFFPEHGQGIYWDALEERGSSYLYSSDLENDSSDIPLLKSTEEDFRDFCCSSSGLIAFSSGKFAPHSIKIVDIEKPATFTFFPQEQWDLSQPIFVDPQ